MEKNEITQRALVQKIKSANANVPNEIARMLEDARNGKDFIMKLGKGTRSNFAANLGVHLNTTSESFKLHRNAITQLAGKFGISTKEIEKYTKYTFEGGAEWQDELVGTILNAHTRHAKQERFLVRAVGNEVRGILSENYKILDSEMMITEFLKVALDAGATYSGGCYTGLAIWIDVIIPYTIKIATENNGDIDVSYGVTIRTSEFGCGALELRSTFENAICGNGMVRQSEMYRKHLGEKLPEGFQFSRETVVANSKKEMLEIRDLTKYCLSEEFVRRTMIQVQNASNIEVDIKAELEKLNQMGLLKREVEETEIILLNNKKEDGVFGEPTLWKLTQAITAMARQKEPERRREIEIMATDLLPKVKEKNLFVN